MRNVTRVENYPRISWFGQLGCEELIGHWQPQSRKSAERRGSVKSQACKFERKRICRIPCLLCLHHRFNCPNQTFLNRYLEINEYSCHQPPTNQPRLRLLLPRSEELLPQLTAGHYLGLFFGAPGGKRFESHFWFTEKYVYADMLLKMATERILDTWKRMDNSSWMQP